MSTTKEWKSGGPGFRCASRSRLRRATLDAAVEVVHKHRFGSCAGTLVATESGFDYRTEHRDAFELPFARVERFELDYVENNLRLKVRGGRTYNFEAPNGEVDPLFVFHRDVQAFREAGN